MAQKQSGSKKPQTKADFVRSMPKSMSPAEIVAEGKKAGIAVTAANVHATRYQDTANGHRAKGGGAKRKKAVKKTLSKGQGKAPETELSSQGAPLRAAMMTLSIGLRDMVRASVREELRSIMGGVFNAPS